MTPEDVQKLPNENDSRAIARHYLAHVQDEKAHVGEAAIDAFDERFRRIEEQQARDAADTATLRTNLDAALSRITALEQAATTPKVAPASSDTH